MVGNDDPHNGVANTTTTTTTTTDPHLEATEPFFLGGALPALRSSSSSSSSSSSTTTTSFCSSPTLFESPLDFSYDETTPLGWQIYDDDVNRWDSIIDYDDYSGSSGSGSYGGSSSGGGGNKRGLVLEDSDLSELLKMTSSSPTHKRVRAW